MTIEEISVSGGKLVGIVGLLYTIRAFMYADFKMTVLFFVTSCMVLLFYYKAAQYLHKFSLHDALCCQLYSFISCLASIFMFVCSILKNFESYFEIYLLGAMLCGMISGCFYKWSKIRVSKIDYIKGKQNE